VPHLTHRETAVSATKALKKPLRSAKLCSSLGSLCTEYSAQCSELGARVWVGHLGSWDHGAGREFWPNYIGKPVKE